MESYYCKRFLQHVHLDREEELPYEGTVPLLVTVGLQIKSPVPRSGSLPLKFFAIIDTRIWKHYSTAIASTLGFPLELDPKTLFLKTTHT